MSINLDELKKEVITEINRLRTNPKAYIPILKKYISWFDGNLLNKPGLEYAIETQEGPAAYENAIEFLKNQRPIKKINFDEEVSKASQSHAEDLSESEDMNHVGSDGRDYNDRVSDYVEWETFLAECIDFGGTSGEEIIVSLLVDDGSPEKANRESLLNEECENFGVGICDHKSFEVCTVIDLVGQIKSYYHNKEKNIVCIQKEAINKMSILAENTEKEKHKKDIDLYLKQQKDKEIYKTLNKEFEEETDRLSNDSDAPEGAVSCKIRTITTKKDNQIVKTITKTYTLEDGSEEVVTLEEAEN